MEWVRVALPLPVDQTYTYSVPEAMRTGLEVGSRVVVPFGRRVLTGVVVEPGKAADADGFEAKPIDDVLDDGSAATPDLLRLTRWMAGYYVCSWGEALRAALPGGLDVSTEHTLHRTESDPGDWPSHAIAGPLLRALGRAPQTLSALRRHVPGATLAIARRLEADGVVTLASGLSQPRVRTRSVAHLRLAAPFQSAQGVKDVLEQVPGDKQKALLHALLDAGPGDWHVQASIVAQADASSSTATSLIKRGLIDREDREVLRGMETSAIATVTPVTLRDEQTESLAAISRQIDAKEFGTLLLHGVTGSGKTEVYIAALRRTLDQGRTGIVLVPEIALTPQTVRRFRAHFGDRIAVLHSRMSLGERYDAWRAIRDGRFQVVIGPRSAVFAPLENIGLIVVDEEHESSYKQFDPAPRYHARDTAILRASLCGATCVLGSATPALETYHNAQTGKYAYLRMTGRAPLADGSEAQLPSVHVLDLTRETKRHQVDGALSRRLVEAIGDRIAKKEQVILLQNRRGYAPILECRDCGWSPFCRDCSVPMPYHKRGNQLRCHYCGRSARRPRACPKCSGQRIDLIGTGTQRVEEQLAEQLPNARILRMDQDSTGRKGAHQKLLDAFGAGDADVLLGTQMVAKGLDFPRVTLVGVISADTGLLLPDFRAEERAFQLMTQVAGRAGRADLAGDVIIQTRRPDQKALVYARSHDYVGFAEYALEERRLLRYPPLGRVVGLEFKGPDERATKTLAHDWTHLLRDIAGGAFEILGPETALIARLKRFYRFTALVKVAPDAPAVQPVLRRTMDAFGSLPSGARVNIDVDAHALT